VPLAGYSIKDFWKIYFLIPLIKSINDILQNCNKVFHYLLFHRSYSQWQMRHVLWLLCFTTIRGHFSLFLKFISHNLDQLHVKNVFELSWTHLSYQIFWTNSSQYFELSHPNVKVTESPTYDLKNLILPKNTHVWESMYLSKP